MPRGRDVNRKTLAEIFGKSLPTIDAMVRRGCPIKSKGSKGREAKFNTADVADWLIGQGAMQAAEVARPKTLDESKARKYAAEAELAELELGEKKKRLVTVEDAAGKVEAEYGVIRQRLRGLPNQVARSLVPLTNPKEIQGILDRALDVALSELSDGM